MFQSVDLKLSIKEKVKEKRKKKKWKKELKGWIRISSYPPYIFFTQNSVNFKYIFPCNFWLYGVIGVISCILKKNRLYSRLEEVKQQKQLKERQRQYVENRQRMKEYQQVQLFIIFISSGLLGNLILLADVVHFTMPFIWMYGVVNHTQYDKYAVKYVSGAF